MPCIRAAQRCCLLTLPGIGESIPGGDQHLVGRCPVIRPRVRQEHLPAGAIVRAGAAGHGGSTVCDRTNPHRRIAWHRPGSCHRRLQHAGLGEDQAGGDLGPGIGERRGGLGRLGIREPPPPGPHRYLLRVLDGVCEFLREDRAWEQAVLSNRVDRALGVTGVAPRLRGVNVSGVCRLLKHVGQ